MKFPERARIGMDLIESFNQVLSWCKATRIIGVAGGRLKETPNGTIIEIPQQTVRAASSSGGRFIVSLSGQDLYVSRGSVYSTAQTDGSMVEPIEPTIDDVALVDGPSWDISEKPDDVMHKVWCVINKYNYDSRLELVTDSPDLEDNESAVHIAEVTFSSDGDTRSAVIEQLWACDISWYRGGLATSSGSGSNDASGSDGSHGSGSEGSSDIDESSNDASSEMSSSEVSSSSGGVPCPTISGVEVTLVAVDGVEGADCIPDKNENAAADDLAYLTYNVAALITEAPEGCRLNMRASIGSGTSSTYLGRFWSGGEATVRVTFLGFPSTNYTVTVSIFQAIGFGGCDLGECTPVTEVITSPPGCSA
ncbi:hypothetical protein JIN84_12995 [Luteolibacter yonseiensis]|uniref:Uncharacterized protein n=1 Tax=Luteolibacter yonseiensis TaxID=1144680 RepID=A0A934R3R0_9BACT|nr:hypothetical protein [Luteolibacter yonseiensis]MBK1816536.1 hypothetical protein [Luteolibacter yonseiensis]